MLRIRARRGYIYVTRTRPHGVPSKRTFATLPLRPVLFYIITFRCFPSHFSSFYFFLADLAADRTCRTAQYTATPLFCPHAARQPVRLPSSHASSLRCAATSRLRALFASFSRTFRQVRGSFCRRTAVRRPVLPLSAPSIPTSSAGERISLRSRFMWNIRLVVRQNLNIYRGFCSFMHIYTLRHCMFFRLCVCFFRPCDPFPVVAPRLTIAPRRRSAAFVSEPRIAARLAVFVGARLHSVFRGRTPSFFDFSISFCLMPHGARKLFVCFSLLPAFRAFPSIIRSASSPVFD